MSQVAHQVHKATMSISTPPLDGILIHHMATPGIYFANTDFYGWMERGTVRVKCLYHEQNHSHSKGEKYNVPGQQRAQTQTIRSRGWCTNHEAIVTLSTKLM